MLRFDEAAAHWRTLFRDWLAVLASGPTSFEQRERATVWMADEQDSSVSYLSYCADYFAGKLWDPEPVTVWQWSHAYEHASLGDGAPLARKLLALATRDAARADGRNAVIHAATAAECALTNGLARHLLTMHSLKEVNSRLDRSRMLGRRFELARQLGLKVPSDANAHLLEPRNATVHSGRHVTDQEAWTAIHIASTIVADFDPLPAHCREPGCYDEAC
jgi:hypothetical protein